MCNSNNQLIRDGLYFYRVFYDDFGEIELITIDTRDCRPHRAVDYDDLPDEVKHQVDEYQLRLENYE